MPNLFARLRDALAGRYAIDRELGQGGMATVYLGRDLKHDRPVALKVLRPELAATLGVERFLQEIRIAAGLNHPHILALHDSGEADGFVYYVMPYVEGESLRQRLDREKQLPLEDALQLAREVASALAYAHSVGIVHRDIKPENILLSGGEAVVADFGIARAITAAAGDRLTYTGIALGTPAYMSPEQAEASGATDARSDLYSLGCVLYEMLAGEPPFTGPTVQAILIRHSTDVARPLRIVRPTVPESVERAVLKALAKVPADRFATAAQFATALLPGGGPDSNRGATALTRAPRRWKALTVGALVSLIAVLGYYLVRVRGLPPHPAPAQPLSLAVLPFQPLTALDGIGSLAIGLPDAIITKLAGVANMRVRPTSAVLPYENPVVDPQAVGRALATDYVLTGTVANDGSRFRIGLQLVRVSDGAVSWGEHYDLLRSDLLRLEDTVATQVTAALNVQLTAAERQRFYHRYTDNVAAYERYLEGRADLLRYRKAETLAAVAAFEAAQRLDPKYALAYAGLALASAQMRIRFAADVDVQGWAERAKSAAARALELDPRLAEAHEALAAVYRYSEFDWEQTVAASRRALELNPNLDLPHYYQAAAFYHLGLLSLVESEVRAGMGSNPENRVEPLRLSGVTALLGGQFARAESLLEVVHRLTEAPVADPYLALARYYHGDHAGAEAMLGAARGSAQLQARSAAILASVLAARGDTGRARALLRDVAAGRYMDHHVAYSIGAGYAQLRQSAEARLWLTRAAETGFPCYPWFRADPLLAPLRGDADFQRLMQQLRESWESAAARYGPPGRSQPG